MGTVSNGSFISSYYGDQIDALLAAMAQANPLPSGTNWVAFLDDCRAAQSAAESAQDAAEYAQDAAEAAQTAATGSASAASTSATSAQGYANLSQNSAADAAENASSATSYALSSQSWAVGGTGYRAGENTDNSKYYCQLAQAAAEQASVPPVEGVYNIIIADRVTGDKYAMVIYNGRLTAVGVAATTEATQMTLVDGATGKNYTLCVNSGRICIEEV